MLYCWMESLILLVRSEINYNVAITYIEGIFANQKLAACMTENQLQK